MKQSKHIDAGNRRQLGAMVGLTLLSLVMAIPAAAQQPAANWAAVVAAAKKEGRVMLYNSVPLPPIQRAAAGFKKLYPDIEVTYQRGPSGQLLSKIDQERNSNADGADILISTEINWYVDRAKEGKLYKVSGPESRAWPAKYLYEGAIPILDLEPFVIVYNKNEVKANPPKGYADLLRPEFRGRLGTTELASTTVIGWYDWLEKTQGADFLQRFKAQNPKMYVGAVPGGQAAASGEVAVSAFNVTTAVTSLVAAGAPIEIVVPNPGLGIQHAAAVFTWSRRPNAAQVFLDYLMSRDGQTAWNGTGESASPLPNIPGALSADSITPVDVTAYPEPLAKAYRERWNKVMK
jgi:iron(III) transport system substrate-binding protein